MDIANAFTAINRDAALDAVQRKAPQLYNIVYHWLKNSTEHVLATMDADDPISFTQHVGLDQGCPLSPAVYCITVAEPLAHIEHVMRTATIAAARDQEHTDRHDNTPPAARSGPVSTARFGCSTVRCRRSRTRSPRDWLSPGSQSSRAGISRSAEWRCRDGRTSASKSRREGRE